MLDGERPSQRPIHGQLYSCCMFDILWLDGVSLCERFNRMTDTVTFDFTLDNIISVDAPKGTDPATLHDILHEKLKELVFDNCDVFMFEGIYEETDDK